MKDFCTHLMVLIAGEIWRVLSPFFFLVISPQLLIHSNADCVSLASNYMSMSISSNLFSTPDIYFVISEDRDEIFLFLFSNFFRIKLVGKKIEK